MYKKNISVIGESGEEHHLMELIVRYTTKLCGNYDWGAKSRRTLEGSVTFVTSS